MTDIHSNCTFEFPLEEDFFLLFRHRVFEEQSWQAVDGLMAQRHESSSSHVVWNYFWREEAQATKNTTKPRFETDTFYSMKEKKKTSVQISNTPLSLSFFLHHSRFFLCFTLFYAWLYSCFAGRLQFIFLLFCFSVFTFFVLSVWLK
ncbi:hypothetical protein DFH11DRAFT_858572 [Phellopilus nigrolimitatus]|nr:hypothetical protein DFH11DRAFT_858572 [Phellopilus nigrolimitatus]